MLNSAKLSFKILGLYRNMTKPAQVSSEIIINVMLTLQFFNKQNEYEKVNFYLNTDLITHQIQLIRK